MVAMDINLFVKVEIVITRLFREPFKLVKVIRLVFEKVKSANVRERLLVAEVIMVLMRFKVMVPPI
jgi:hypothetical protein